MTGYKSKKEAAQDKLDDDDLTIASQSGYYDGKKAAQPAQKRPSVGLTDEAFNTWWDTKPSFSDNPCMTDSFEYWAWEGWHAALAQLAQEQNFCFRCGKRTKDIHICTSPQGVNSA